MRRKNLLRFFVWPCIFLSAFSCGKKSAPPPAQTAGGQERGSLAALAIGAGIRWPQVYAGDPLLVQVRIWSPKERQELYKGALKAEQGQKLGPAAYEPPKVADDWASSVELNLFKVDKAGKRATVLPAQTWGSSLVKPKTGISLAGLGLANRSARWIVPSDDAKLTEGRYVLTVSWKGGSDAALPPGRDRLSGKELVFEVKSAAADSEKAGHLGRLAYCEFIAGRYEQARANGRQALVLDPDSLLPERIETWFIVANASTSLKDFKAAKETLKALMGKLPPPESSDIALAAQQALDALEEADKSPEKR